VTACRPFHLLPRNVWARTPALAARVGTAVEALDAALLRLPGLRRLATAWALIAARD
jgi:hypothetical protein